MTLLTPAELQIWLEWAGARLIAMPGRRIGPAAPKVIWPDYSQETFQVLEHRGAMSVKVAAPSSKEIPIVDEILILPNVCSRDYVRRVLHVRSLVHPLNGRYLYKWTRIAELLDVKPRTIKMWHRQGLEEVVDKADPVVVKKIYLFMNNGDMPVLANSSQGIP